MQLTVARDMGSLQDSLTGLVRTGKRIGLVPTMGALHAGHLSLIRLAQTLADAVVVTIFVNPKQFGPNDDFSKYPRMLDDDIAKAGEAGAALVYAPDVDDLYPAGFSTSVSAGEMSTILDGHFRPGHFDGVATVVSKLLLRTLPHVAVFGEKDYQQLCIIRRVTSDLDIPVEIAGAPIIREADGLAMSSRNAYLSPEERRTAPKIYETLSNVGMAITARSISVAAAVEQGAATLGNAGFRVDYMELRTADTLEPVKTLDRPSRLLVAAWLGKTRLIDNIALE